MTENMRTVGVDVGGPGKGFHAVCLDQGRIIEITHTRDPGDLVAWICSMGAAVVAIDAPCGWSAGGKSRLAERELQRAGIHSFYTPARADALASDFYRWVFNGESLYRLLAAEYPLFDGQSPGSKTCFETFPHAVTWQFAPGYAIREKRQVRKAMLERQGCAVDRLTNIDLVDAAVCAMSAEVFSRGERFVTTYPARNAPGWQREEGLIVVPDLKQQITIE